MIYLIVFLLWQIAGLTSAPIVLGTGYKVDLLTFLMYSAGKSPKGEC